MAADNKLFFGDNLEVLREHLEDNCVDLIYLDPPFQSGRNYNVLFQEKDGSKAPAQIKAFDDTWKWDVRSRRTYEEVVEEGGTVSKAMQAFMTFLGSSNLLAYLSMMAPRLKELRRVLKPTGLIYLHCDPTASHYLKILMDAVFGADNCRNEIVWCYRGGGVPKNDFSRKHDIILRYSKTDDYCMNVDPVRIPYSESVQKSSPSRYDKSYRKNKTYSGYTPNPQGKHPEDWWVLQALLPSDSERLGYPTQKPMRLLRKIILSSSDEGDIILDPFCGGGTTIAVSQELERKWIGIDITHIAINLVKHRLKDMFGGGIEAGYDVIGEPTTVAGAEKLAKEDRFQFEFWALGLVGARPEEEKKGADKGIDGQIFFHDDKGETTKQIVISVKSGDTGPRHVRELRGVVEREDAEIGVLITLQEPTRKMKEEAGGASFYESPLGGKYPRVQIITIKELLEGGTIAYPRAAELETFKRAKRAGKEERQEALLTDTEDGS